MQAPNEIQAYLHWKKCTEELPEGQSPMEYARTQSGWKNKGLQIWCNRHDENVMHLDFKGTYQALEEMLEVEIPYNGIVLAELPEEGVIT